MKKCLSRFLKKFFLAAGLLILLVHPARVLRAATNDPDQLEDMDSIQSVQMIEERMKSLSGSLAELPKPPKMDETIQLPLSSEVAERAQSKGEKKQSVHKSGGE